MSSVNIAASSSGYTTHALPARDAVPLDAAEGVSWRSIFAGAVAACSLTFLLLMLGGGLGLASVSPWKFEGVETSTLAIGTVAWIVFTQIAASGLGGYMAGRLRGRWTRPRDHEVYFRDTAHGLLAWGVSTLAMVALMGAAAGGLINQSTRAVGTAATVAATAMGGDGRDDSGYWIDAMLRANTPAAGQVVATPLVDPATDATMRAQATRIFVHAIQVGSLPADDASHLATMVSQRTGLPLANAQQRVNETYAKAKKAIDDTAATVRRQADEARKATAYTAMWMVIALMAGAFVAAWLATFGGRQRDAAVVAL
jgi:hypothetical protein